eukprot:15463925-Alexandrium_andersonii.AAC.1
MKVYQGSYDRGDGQEARHEPSPWARLSLAAQRARFRACVQAQTRHMRASAPRHALRLRAPLPPADPPPPR